jgi:nitrogen regulatory protein PII
VLLNPYGVAAFAALAGMFSRQATDKLREVFETVFTAQKPVPRSEPLKGKPATITVEPAELSQGFPQVLTVTGSGFDKDIKATIEGKPREVQWISDKQLKITAVDDDVATVGKVELVLKNPNNDTFTATINVVE